MAKESFNAGDKIVPKNPELWKYGIWTVEGELPYHIIAYCLANGKRREKIIPKSDICKIEKGNQICFYWYYD